MRIYHNDIKRKILLKYSSVNKIKLLDLATGKGGDLHKWKTNKNIMSVLGIDINKHSIKEAKKRLKTLNIKKNIIFKIKDLSSDKLQCADNKKYEMITSFFAFHYFFKNNDSLNNILASINNCSKQGTILILTLFDGDKIKDIITKNYYIKIIEKSTLKKIGKKIEVFIKDSVLNEPEIEYIVYPDILISKLKLIGFELEEKISFKELYNSKFKLNNDEKILSFLNNLYVFKKK